MKDDYNIIIESISEKKRADDELNNKLKEKELLSNLEMELTAFKKSLNYNQLDKYDKIETLYNDYLKLKIENTAVKSFRDGLQLGLEIK